MDSTHMEPVHKDNVVGPGKEKSACYHLAGVSQCVPFPEGLIERTVGEPVFVEEPEGQHWVILILTAL